MQRIHLCSKPLGSCTEWAVSYMRVTLCRGRVGVTEKATDDLKAEATRNKVGRVGVAIVMQPIVGNSRLRGDAFPKPLDVLKRSTRCITRE